METAICKTSDQISEEILIPISETKGFHTPTGTITPRGGSPLKDINSDLKIIGQKVNGHLTVESKKNDEFSKADDALPQKSVSPTLIEHAFKVVKNLFSPEKVRSKPLNVLNSISPQRSPPMSPCNSIYIPNSPRFCTPDPEPENVNKDNLNSLGKIRTSLNNTNDSYLTAVSLIDDSFQSTVTDLDGYNEEGMQSENVTLLNGSGVNESYLENTLLKNNSFTVENKPEYSSHEESLNETQVRNVNVEENGVNEADSEKYLPNGDCKPNGELKNVENLFVNSSFTKDGKTVEEKECEGENDVINVKKIESEIDFLSDDRENVEKSISTTTVVLSNADSNELQGLLSSLNIGASSTNTSVSSLEESPGILDCTKKLSPVKNSSKSEGNSPTQMSSSGKNKLNKSVDFIYSKKSPKGKQRKPVRSNHEISANKNEEVLRNNAMNSAIDIVQQETVENIKSDKELNSENLEIEIDKLDFDPDEPIAIVSQQSYTILHNTINATISRPVISSQCGEILKEMCQVQHNIGDSPDVNKVVTPKQSTPISSGVKSMKKSKNSKGQVKANPLNLSLDSKSIGSDDKIENKETTDLVGESIEVYNIEEQAEFSPVIAVNDSQLILVDSENTSPAMSDAWVVPSNESFEKKQRSPKKFGKKMKSPNGDRRKSGSPRRLLRDVKAEAPKFNETFDKPSRDFQVRFNETFDKGSPEVLNSTYDRKSGTPDVCSTGETLDIQSVISESPVLNQTFDKSSGAGNSNQMKEMINSQSDAANTNQMNQTFDKQSNESNKQTLNEEFDTNSGAIDQGNQTPENDSNQKQKGSLLNVTFDKKSEVPELQELNKNDEMKLVSDELNSNNLNQTFDINSGAKEQTKLNQTFDLNSDSQKTVALNQTFVKKSVTPDLQELNENFDRKSDTSDYMTDSLEKDLGPPGSGETDTKSDVASSKDVNQTFVKESGTVNSKELNQEFEGNPGSLVSTPTTAHGDDKLNQTFDKVSGTSASHQLNQTYDKESTSPNSIPLNQTFDKKSGTPEAQELNQTYCKSEEIAPQLNETFKKPQFNQTFERKPSRLSQTLEKVPEEVTPVEEQEVQKLFEMKKGTLLHKSRKFNLTFDKDDGMESSDVPHSRPSQASVGPEEIGVKRESEIHPLNESFLSTRSSNTSFTSNETVIMNPGPFMSNDVDGLTEKVGDLKINETKVDNFMWLDVAPTGCLDLGEAGKVMLEDLSPTIKDDKIPCDNELAELIQQQFSNSDIEKICTVVDDISSRKLSNQILQTSEQFDKSFHESLIKEKAIGITPQSLDYFNSIGGKQGARDLSRVSLYVKFDPLVQSPKSLIDFTKEAQALAAVDSPPPKTSPEQRPLLDLSPQKKREEIGPLTPMSNKNNKKDDQMIIKELQNEIYFLKNLYAEKEKANKVRLEEYDTQVTLLKDKLKESCNKFKEIESLRVIIDESFNVISKLTAELETSKIENAKKIETLTAERDSYMNHLQNTEAAFIHILGKYEKCKKTIVQLKANETTYKNAIAEQTQKLKESKERAREAQEKAFAEFQKIQEELNETETNHHREMARIRAQIRKTELKLEDLQE